MSDYKLAARVTRIERERESVCDRKDNKIRGERGRRRDQYLDYLI